MVLVTLAAGVMALIVNLLPIAVSSQDSVILLQWVLATFPPSAKGEWEVSRAQGGQAPLPSGKERVHCGPDLHHTLASGTNGLMGKDEAKQDY